jgi:hypothetical protein
MPGKPFAHGPGMIAKPLLTVLLFASVQAFSGIAQAQTGETPYGTGIPSNMGSFQWATPVHNQMVEMAFGDLGWRCIEQMKAGSRYADSGPFQSGEYSYMHAMRNKGQSPGEAARKMWKYVDDKYAEVQLLLRDNRGDDACYLRGMALHPVMDSTSPAHRGFEQWDPVSWQDLLKPSAFYGKLARMSHHGDWQKYLDRLVQLPVNFSDEDMNVIDDHPEYLRVTVDLLRNVDSIELELSQ